MGSALSSGVWKALRQKSVGFVLTSLGLGLLTGSAVWANSDVEKNIANEKNWAMQAGDMSNQRYMGIRHGEPLWKAQIETVIQSQQAQILAILKSFDVPVLEVPHAATKQP